MLATIKEGLLTQFGAGIKMLENTISLCPEENLATDRRFFYMSYHVLVFLDYYSTIPSPETFTAPLPFTFTEAENLPPEAIDDILPDRIYTKTELLHYLETSREKCRRVINSLTVEKLAERWIEKDGDMDYSVFEILLYNIRHVQHHAAQLNLLLRQKTDTASKWVARD